MADRTKVRSHSALALTGPERFLTMLMDSDCEAWCRKLLELCSRVNIAIGEAQLRAAAHSSTIGLAGASLISPQLFERFELPGAKAYCAALKRNGGFAFVHACGHELLMLETLDSDRSGLLGTGPGDGPRERANESYKAERVCLE